MRWADKSTFTPAILTNSAVDWSGHKAHGNLTTEGLLLLDAEVDAVMATDTGCSNLIFFFFGSGTFSVGWILRLRGTTFASIDTGSKVRRG